VNLFTFAPVVGRLAAVGETPAVALDATRCVRRVNRASPCALCAEGCPTAAITVAEGDVTLDPAACVACGFCLHVCPTGAFTGDDETAKVWRTGGELLPCATLGLICTPPPPVPASARTASASAPSAPFAPAASAPASAPAAVTTPAATVIAAGSASAGSASARSASARSASARSASARSATTPISATPATLVAPAADAILQVGGCLGALDAAAYVGLAALGVQQVNLHLEACPHCPLGALRPAITRTAASAAALAAITIVPLPGAAVSSAAVSSAPVSSAVVSSAAVSSAAVSLAAVSSAAVSPAAVPTAAVPTASRSSSAAPSTRSPAKPPPAQPSSVPVHSTRAPQISRRSLLRRLTGGGAPKAPAALPLLDPLEPAGEGPKVMPRTRRALLHAYAHLPASRRTTAPYFPVFAVAASCTGCGLCATVCPTGALQLDSSPAVPTEPGSPAANTAVPAAGAGSSALTANTAVPAAGAEAGTLTANTAVPTPGADAGAPATFRLVYAPLACTDCGLCTQLCAPGALQRTAAVDYAGAEPWILYAAHASHCSRCHAPFVGPGPLCPPCTFRRAHPAASLPHPPVHA
jgi:ferredoxin